jgi:DNA-binding transcriptional LysR family regulator
MPLPDPRAVAPGSHLFERYPRRDCDAIHRARIVQNFIPALTCAGPVPFILALSAAIGKDDGLGIGRKTGMSHSRFSTRLLRYMVAIADAHSFSRASTSIGRSQPVLSAGIKRLEESVGFTIFSRNGRSVTLTSRGAEFLPFARAVVTAADRVGRLTIAVRSGAHGGFRFGYPPYLETAPEVRTLRDEFADDHPEIAVSIYTAFSHTLLEGLLAREYDVALLLGRPESERLTVMSCRRMVAQLLVPAESRLAALPSIPPDAWHGLALVGSDRSHSPIYFDRVMAPVLALGAELVPAQAPSFSGLVRHARQHRLPTLVFRDLLPPADCETGAMVLRRIKDDAVGIEACLTTRADEHNTAINLMRKAVRRALLAEGLRTGR